MTQYLLAVQLDECVPACGQPIEARPFNVLPAA